MNISVFKKMKIRQIVRRAVQLAAFLLLPGLFISVFSAFGDVVSAIAGGTFSFSALTGQLILLLAAVSVTALFGRFFCGWLCAFGAMGDFIWFVSGKISGKRLKVNERADRALKGLKYVILILIAIFLWALGLSLLSVSSPWTIFGMYASVSGWPQGAYFLSVGGALLLLIIAGSALVERFFCRYLCPLGAIFALSSRFRLFRISKPREKCGKCTLCTRACPMGIPLYETDAVTSGECVACLSCLDACPRNNVRANPAPAAAAAMSAAAITGLYYVGSLVPQSTLSSGGAPAVTETAASGQYTDGVYTGSAAGYRGTTSVQVTVENGSISDIVVLSTGDDTEFFSRAENTVINSILTLQTTEVDAVSGATFSSNAIKNAVAEALGTSGESAAAEEIASGETSSDGAPSSEETAPSAETGNTGSETQSGAEAALTDGVYEGTGTGFRGDVVVSVTVEDGKISGITVVSSQDDYQYFSRAENSVISEIVAAQSVDVDAVSGATFSSNGIIEAVADALGITYENPNGTLGESGHPGNGFGPGHQKSF